MQVSIDDAELFYTVQGEGRPMLLLHPVGLDHMCFRPWLDELSRKCQLVYFDHRGCGRSTRLDTFEGVEHNTWVDDAEALREELGLEPCIVFGHSSGGFLALEYALRFPESVAGLVLCSTAAAINYTGSLLMALLARAGIKQIVAMARLMAGPKDNDAFRMNWLEVLPLYLHRHDPSIARALTQDICFSAAAYHRENSHCVPAFNVLDRLQELTMPTLVVVGGHDWMCPLERAAKPLCDRIPDATLMVLEESCHFPFVEEQDLFAQGVGDWLDDLERAAV